jgi:predicted RecB family nuclease
MKHVISSKAVVAYYHCPRKAFLFLFSDDKKEPHEYVCILENQADINRAKYLNALEQAKFSVDTYEPDSMERGGNFLVDVTLKAHNFEAYCDALTNVQSSSSFGKHSYEPVIVVGTHSIMKEQKIELAFVGQVLGQVQNQLPVAGTIVGAETQTHRVNLDNFYKELKPIILTLKEWVTTSPSEPPPVILNKNCPYCQFRNECREKAENGDDLSLLDRMTPKLIQRYHRKGIFTVTQLSYLFKPRRNRKRTKKAEVRFNPELQALAIRTGKIYIQELPELPRQPVELFFDIEGIPDQNFNYLMGLLVCEGVNTSYHSFWASTTQDEEQIWHDLLAKANQYPEAPIYHDGSYEPRAVDRLTRRYQIESDAFKKRLFNISSCVYGKVYFPVKSNGLKELGKFLGASWTSSDGSGLQSLVWRYHWEKTHDSYYKQMLITYNEEDCQALQSLTEQLSKIREAADSQEDIDFADRPKQNATERGSEIHGEFEHILRNAHANYSRNRVKIRPQKNVDNVEKKKRGAPEGHQGYQRMVPSRAGKVVRVPIRRRCPKHKGEPLQISQETVSKTVIDLRFTKTGCRKTVTKYMGRKGYCRRCRKSYDPRGVERLGDQLFGHGIQAWAIYQRIFLRLPYRIIIQEMEDLFGERMSISTIVNFFWYLTQYYAATQDLLARHILESPFIHVDETRLINGSA